MSTPTATPAAQAARALPTSVEVAVVGAGFSGLGMAMRLREAGHHDFAVLEAAGDVGGTWRENTYPGCACDIPSHLYSFSFRPNAEWTRAYSRQPEIQRYLQACAHERGLAEHLHTGCTVTDATWDERGAQWRLRTSRGALSARWLVLATGPLSEPAIPRLPGSDAFAGPSWHSARWNHAVDLRGLDVAVVGTGASAIQFVPELQKIAGRVAVYQRSAPWILPRGDRPIDERARRRLRRVPGLRRAARAGTYAVLEMTVPALLGHRRWLALGERYAARHLAAQVPDLALRAKLTPAYQMGCKRILSSDDYLPAVGRPNVEVVTDRIAEVTATGIRTTDGTPRPADVLVYGTGFVVMDPSVTRIVHGRHGLRLTDVWGGSPTAHRGTTVHGFPNLFLLLGPNTGLGHNSVILMAEAQIGYVLDALEHAQRAGATVLEVTGAAQAGYNAWLDRRSIGTVWTDGRCESWYLDADGRNTSIWPGWAWDFQRRMRRFDHAAYRFGTR